MHTFTTDDLRNRSDEIVGLAEAGQLSVITQRGRPLFVALPVAAALQGEHWRCQLAMHLFSDVQVSLGKAAELAGLSTPCFIDALAQAQVALARPEVGELEQELKALGDWNVAPPT
jgi:prevent-host-death family protein